MKVMKQDLLLYAVTDRTWLKEEKLAVPVERALKAGITFLQYREKNLPYAEFLLQARELNRLAKRYGVPLIINDNVEAAIETDAAGVHLGQEDEQLQSARERLGPDKIIGISAHTAEEARIAQEYGADYIGAGAVFGSTTKREAGKLSREVLSAICHAVTIPVVAIGGINRENILELAGTGTAGAAVISAIFAQSDIEEAVREMLYLARKMTGIV